MLHFQYSSLINATVEEVWNFHEREDILKILTPPWQPVKMIRREDCTFKLSKYLSFYRFWFLAGSSQPSKRRTG